MESSNPFFLPEGQSVFEYRVQQRQIEKEHRNRIKNGKIWEKSKKSMTGKIFTLYYVGFEFQTCSNHEEINGAENKVIASNVISQANNSIGIASSANEHSNVEKHNNSGSHKETLIDFVKARKSNFVFNLTVANKKSEISRLEQEAEAKKKKLMEVEYLLESDAIKFEKFLKENGDAAHAAIKRQDEMIRERQDRNAEIKRLNARIQKTETSIGKLNDQLEDLLKYKVFLDGLTPPEWFANIKSTELQLNLENEPVSDQELLKLRACTEDDENEGIEHTKIDDLYFAQPEQLLSIFTDMETRNLFLIQNAQALEEALEDLTIKTAQLDSKLSDNIKGISNNLVQIQTKIVATKNRSEQIQKESVGVAMTDSSDFFLSNLTRMIAAMGAQLGINDSEPTHVLAEVEKKWNSLMSDFELINPEFLENAERMKENIRRSKERDLRLELQNSKLEERMQRTKNRANFQVNKVIARNAFSFK